MNAPVSPYADLRLPVDVASAHFADNRARYFRWLRDEAPVHRGRVSVMRMWFLSRYDDCWALLRDPRFVRNRGRARGKGNSAAPVPMPRSIRHLAESMIVSDDPAHARLRGLVQKAFTSSAIASMESSLRAHAHALLDDAKRTGHVDLQTAYASPIPVRAISEMMGLETADAPRFHDGLTALSDGLSGWTMLRTLLWDLPRLDGFVRELIERKRVAPGNDILTALIAAEEDGDRLQENELVSMVFLLIIAGFETTVHLISNLVLTLLTHPDQLARLRADPALIEGAVEEGLRFCGPIHGTKPCYPIEDVTIHGITIPRGATVVPVLGAANLDPREFEDPECFDIGRPIRRHLGLGRGIHFCLGSQLARMETRVAVEVLLERCPNLALAVDATELVRERMPLWNRYARLPVRLG